MVLSTIITSVLWSHYTKFIFTFSLINNYLLEKKGYFKIDILLLLPLLLL